MGKNVFPLYKKLNREHRARLFLRPCGVLLAVTAFSLAIQQFLFPAIFRQTLSVLFRAQLCTAAILLATALSAAGTLFFRHRRKPMETAAALDAEADAKNRLEAAFELRNTNHILKDALLEDAAAAYRGFRFSKRPAWLNLISAGICMVLILNLLLLANSRSVSLKAAKTEQSAQEKKRIDRNKEKKKKEKEAETLRLAAENAELLLTLPEPETRAKPLDEIEWEGTGNSSNGFTKIVLSVFVNGEKKTDLEPDSQPKRKGEIKISGFILLEDLDVKPFDLVSYHLTGISSVHGKNTAILSTPQFIEVRPFREDTRILEGMAVSSDMFNILSLFLEIQIDLNKALFRAEILQRQAGGKTEPFKKALLGLETEQGKLSADLEQFLNSEDARKIPADAVNHLEKSLENMKKTCLELKRSL